MRYGLDIAAEQLVGSEGMALAGGRYVATVISQRTGIHVTIRLTAKRPPQGTEIRWRVCPFKTAKRVFADVPRGGDLLVGDSPGVYLPSEGIFRSAAGADPPRVWAALFALRVAAGLPRNEDAYVLQSTNCFHCGRELTDPESITRGIGPVCYGKLTKSQHQVKGPAPKEVIGTKIAEQTALEVGA